MTIRRFLVGMPVASAPDSSEGLPLFLFRRIVPLALDRGENADDGVIEFHDFPLPWVMLDGERGGIEDDPSKMG
jgi:hypothetical protein